jgi:DeoR family transcriptional regulator, L-fucose operon activator
MLVGRMREIANRVDHLGSVTVVDLADQFGVAVETIRRDLRVLEESGYLRRTHGGAVSVLDDDAGTPAFGSRQMQNAAAKKEIAQQAVAMVREGDVLMLDQSSSCWYFAQALPNITLTIITNSIRVIFDLVQKPKIKVIAIGGEYFEKYGAFLGVIAVNCVHEFQADICFHSCGAFHEDLGAWDSNELNAGVKKAMLRASRSNVLLCDTSKFNRTAFALVNSVDRIHCMISEDGVRGAVLRPADQHRGAGSAAGQDNGGRAA